MLSRVKVVLLALPCLILNLAVDAHAQNGRLFGQVVYSRGAASPARGVRVIAVGSYVRSETRTDNYGNFGMVLPSGTYRIVGQGASPYVQRVEVTGYVRPYADSYIYPNPLVLEYQRFRSSGISLPPIALNEANVDQQIGVVIGLVTRRIQGRLVAASDVSVKAFGDYGRLETRTNKTGFFKLELRPGNWRILVTPTPGFYQRDEKRVAVKPNDRVNVFIELLPIAASTRLVIPDFYLAQNEDMHFVPFVANRSSNSSVSLPA